MSRPSIIDTHAHLDTADFKDDVEQVIERAKNSGISKIFIPGVDFSSIESVMALCKKHLGYLFPMAGLQPEEVKPDYPVVLDAIHKALVANLQSQSKVKYIAIGEVGLDFYWSREYEKEQTEAFERQIVWSIELGLPLEIHCRKAQNELIHIFRNYERELPGGVFHCFTGNANEAEAYLQFPKFMLGIGGVSTFKSSHLPEVLPKVVPLDRIVLETDSPYMAPVPHRGKRNEPSFTVEVLTKLAQAYSVSEEQLAEITCDNVKRVFGI